MPSLEIIAVLDAKVRELCRRPYLNHPQGCPNWNTKSGCPPQVKTFVEIFDISRSLWAIYNRFPLGEHVEQMRLRHPTWTEAQLVCCLYWQPRARKQLREQIKLFLFEHPGLWVTQCPEALGVNVTETMSYVGHDLEWPPKNIAYQVAIAGSPRNLDA